MNKPTDNSKYMLVLDWDIPPFMHMNTVQPAKEVVIRIPSYKSTITRHRVLKSNLKVRNENSSL